MLIPYLANRSCKAGQLWLCSTVVLSIIFFGTVGVVSAQQFYGGPKQQNTVPVMQQSGEIIIEYYYPATPQQYYVPLPQESIYQPPQIGFPTPQPRFLSSGTLYIDPNPAPVPQSNIYGEVIIGEFEESAPQITKTQPKAPEQRDVDQNKAKPSEQAGTESPKTEDDDLENSSSNPDALAKQGSDQGNKKETDDDSKMPSQADPPATQDKDVAAAESKAAAPDENIDPDSTSDTSPEPNGVASTDPTKTRAGSKDKQLAAQNDDAQNGEADSTKASLRRSDNFMDPLGPIAEDQKTHLFWVTVLTMVAILPVFVLLPLILFKYRRGRKQQETYQPKWDSSSFLEILMWGVPVVLVTFMSARLWHSTHVLDPYAEINSKNPTVNVQVVGLDWKWLFIYPDLGIATVGEFNMPVDQPVSMTLTTDTVMQSFSIPALAGQIYAMPGMTTELNLIADQLGSMEGENTQFNGDGFSEQKFMTNVMSTEDFEAWVEQVKQNSIPMDEASYKTLALRTRQSKAVADLATDGMPAGVVYFTLDDEQFFMNIMMRYMNHKPLKDEDQPGSPAYGVSDQTALNTGEDQ